MSDQLSSLMIAQLTELHHVLSELFHATGASISLRPAHLHVDDQPVPYAGVVAAARARAQSHVAIGYRLAGGQVTLNPPKSSSITLTPEDQVVVLA